MVGNKIADKITSVSNKKSTKELPNDETKEKDVEITTHQKRYVSPEEKQQIIDELRYLKRMHSLQIIDTHIPRRKTTNYL